MKAKLGFILPLLLITNAHAITLEEAVKTALNKNNELRAKKVELKQKEVEFEISRLRLLPSVDIYTDYNKTTDPPYAIMNRMEVKKLDMFNTDFNDPGKSQLFRTGVKTTIPIWLGGKLRIAKDIAKKEVKATKSQLKRSKQQVIFDVVKAYYNVLTARSYIETAQLAVKDAKKHLKDAEAVYKAGLGIKSDYLRAKVYLEQMEENLIKAKSNYEIAKRALAVAIGTMPTEGEDVEGELTYKRFSFNLQNLIEIALQNRPELKEIDIRLQQTDDAEKMAKANFLPSIGAFGDYFLADDSAPWNKENSSWTIGFQATLNLFNGGIKFKELEKARLTKLKVKELKEKAKKGIAFEVSRAYYNFISAEKRIELAEAALKSAQESLRIVEKRFKNGLATITELLDTQTALNQARTNYVAALSAYRLAVAEIYYAAGILDKRYQELSQ